MKDGKFVDAAIVDVENCLIEPFLCEAIRNTRLNFGVSADQVITILHGRNASMVDKDTRKKILNHFYRYAKDTPVVEDATDAMKYLGNTGMKVFVRSGILPQADIAEIIKKILPEEYEFFYCLGVEDGDIFNHIDTIRISHSPNRVILVSGNSRHIEKKVSLIVDKTIIVNAKKAKTDKNLITIDQPLGKKIVENYIL